MATLKEIREKYPQYKDLSDQQLADGLYKKFYSDMPREEFDRKVGLADQPAQQLQQPGMGGNTLRGALQAGVSGATFGFNDELQAGIAGGVKSLTGYGKTYDEKLAQARAEESQFRQNHPIAGAGLTVGGALATLPATAAAAGPASAMTIPKVLGLGAAEGALAGFGAAEGGTAERLRGAGTGAALGGATAGVASAALPVLGLGARTGKALFQGKQGRAKNRALGKTAQAMKRDEKSNYGQLAKDYTDNQTRNYKPEVLADYGGENAKDLVAAAHSVPGKGKNQTEQFLVKRQMGDLSDPTVSTGQAARVSDDAAQALAGGKTKSANQTVDELLEERKRAAGPLYEGAKKFSDPIDVAPILSHLEQRLGEAKGPIRAALERARRMLVDPEGNPESRLASLHEAKLALDEMMDRSAQNSLGNTARREVREIQTMLLGAMDQGSHGLYAAARARFAGPSRSMEAVQMGRRIFAEDAEITAKEIRNLSPTDREFFTVGVIQAVRDRAQLTANTGDVVRNIVGNPRLRERLGAAVPNAKDFTNFVFDLEREAAMSRTLAKTRGSRTTPLKESVEDAGETVAGAAVDAMTGNKLGLVRRGINAVRGNGKLDEHTAAEIRNLLVNPDGPRAALTQLQKYDDQIKAMVTRRRAIAEALARTAGTQGQNVNQEADAARNRFGFR